jgi:lysophospholipase L1-like esterase
MERQAMNAVMASVAIGLAMAVCAESRPATSQPTTGVTTMSANEMLCAPRKSWRVRALSASAGLGEALCAGRDGALTVAAKREAAFAVHLPQMKTPVLVTLEPNAWVTQITAKVSIDSTDGATGTWQTLVDVRHDRGCANSLAKVEVPSGAACWVRVTVRVEGDMPSEGLRISDIGVYEIDPAGANDYWLSVGASIQHQSLRSGVFKKLVREKFGYDPVLFNRAVPGWRTQDLLKALPTFLKDHRHARYVTIHIGGNDISGNRPYPRGAEALRADLIAIAAMISDAGKTPLLSTISYRAYAGDFPVPPEENGSGPYVVNVFEPVIREHCPWMIDATTNRPCVDAYAWFKAHPDELSEDGIHVNARGEFSWNRLWVDGVGPKIYGSAK